MTVTYPDVSHYNAPLSLAGAALVFAKATQGTGYVDPAYAGYRAQAAVYIPFGAYHWLDTSDPVAQARHAYNIVGPGTPLMIDDEQPSISVPHTLAFVAEYRRLGGLVVLEYLPRWTWAASGTPDLRPLAAAGLHLVASDYNPRDAAYPAGLGWEPYGGVTPAILQYTDRQPFSGKALDMNVFPGNLGELLAIISGGTDMTPEESRQLAAIYNALFYGGSSCGDPAHGSPVNSGSQGNAIVDQLRELRAGTAAIQTTVQAPAAATKQLVDQEVSTALSAGAAAVTPKA